MKIEEFKESGLLELYALNACSTDEKLVVEECLILYPELLLELNEISQSLEYFAESHAQIPPAGLDEIIKKQLVFKAPSKLTNSSKETKSETSNLRIYQYALAASIIAIIGLSISLIATQVKLDQTKEQLAILNQEKMLLSDKVNRASYELADLNQNFRKIESDSFVRIDLKATEKYPNAQMKVFWNKQSKETYVSMINIPELPQGKQFQLWALVNGLPINAGVFDSLQGVLVLSSIATSQADLFAVTIENTGGSQSPTLSEMVVAGKVAGS